MPDTLLLVDGSNQAFRAHFSNRVPMRTPDGFPTRALLGFAMVLRKLVADIQPSHVAVVFDKGKTFRHEMYPAYKAKREAMPDELRRQWEVFLPLTREMGMCALAVEGVEADDVIGALAVEHGSKGLPVIIVSSDKDLCQLVNDHVSIYDVGKEARLGPAEVSAKWGVGPEQIIDLLSLCGDTSDNVPGVPGVGPKKAAKYLNKYGSAEAVLAHAADIGGKTGQRIAESVEVVALARRLVTIRTQLDLGISLGDLALGAPRLEELRARAEAWNSSRLREWYGEESDTRSGTAIDRSAYSTVVSPSAVDELAEDLREAGRFAFDTETDSLNAHEATLVGMSFAWGDEGEELAVYVPVAHASGLNCPDALSRLGPVLSDPAVLKTGQNLKYDAQVLARHGVQLAGIDGDTMIADYLVDVDRKHGLDAMARRLLNHEMLSFAETTKEVGGLFANVAVEDATAYAAEDAHVAWVLDRLLGQELEAAQLVDLYRELELPLLSVLARMESLGIGVDLARLEALAEELGGRVAEMKTALHAEAGEEFNVNSTKQLASILYDEDKLNLKPIKKTKTGYSTAANVLHQHAADGVRLCQMILEYRELAKLLSTYVIALPKHVGADGRIHTSFHQAVAATGRLSSNDPNLQNIPIRTAEGRRIRECFVPAPGHVFLSCDYSQIELRVLAHYCGEGVLLESFLKGEDIHRRTAAEVFRVPPEMVSPELRRRAKAVNFGLIYGQGAFGLSQQLGIPRREAVSIIEAYFDRYPAVQAFMDQAIAVAKEQGYAVTLWGRRRPVYNLDSSNRIERAASERIAVNTPIQGSAADVIKRAMLRVQARLDRDFPDARLLLQVHDELVLEVPEAMLDAVQAAVVAEMEGAADLAVPLVVDAGSGRTWDEAH